MHGRGRSPRPEEKIAAREGPGREQSKMEKLHQGPMLHMGVKGRMMMITERTVFRKHHIDQTLQTTCPTYYMAINKLY
jgi:hypothetical protein